jgi:hypothetical protein
MTVTAYRVVWRDRSGVMHASSPGFPHEEEARRFARSLRRAPDVVEAQVVPVTLQPVQLPKTSD